MSPKKEIFCSFCNKSHYQVDSMIEGPQHNGVDMYICNECVDCSHAAIHTPSQTATNEKSTVLTPLEILTHLDKFVIGQTDAKRAISVAIYNHHKRINDTLNTDSDVEIQKANAIVIGPSGTGKTLIASTVAKIVDLPFAIGDATTLTERGYIGGDVESLIERLLASADGDVSKAQHGIIFIDEIDKKALKDKSSGSKDVSGEGVQQALLKLVEGTVVSVQHGMDTVDVDTTNILFIIGGAFVGLSEIVKKSLQGNVSIGFGADIQNVNRDADLFKQATANDLTKFGLIPEFVGRFPVMISLDELDKDMMIRILKEPQNSILKQYHRLFEIDGVTLAFDDKYIEAIAELGLKQQTGARGLRSVIERDLADVQFELPNLAKSGIRHIYVQKDGTIKQTKRKRSIGKKVASK